MHGPPKDSPDLPVQAHHDPRLFPDTAPSRHPDNPPTVPRSVDAHVLWKCLLHGDWWRGGGTILILTDRSAAGPISGSALGTVDFREVSVPSHPTPTPQKACLCTQAPTLGNSFTLDASQ